MVPSGGVGEVLAGWCTVGRWSKAASAASDSGHSVMDRRRLGSREVVVTSTLTGGGHRWAITFGH